MRVVADTNVIISMLLWGKSLEKLFVLVNARKIVLCFSPETIDELFRVVQYARIEKQATRLKVPIEELLDKLLSVSEIFYPAKHISIIIQDPADNRILEAAIAAEATFVISGDKHLLKLRQIRNIPILSPQEFIKKIIL